MKQKPPLLEVNNIEVVYSQTILAVYSITLRVDHGDVVCLLGANGAGKTTTLKACSNLLHAERGLVTKGVIKHNGRPTTRLLPDELVSLGIVQVLEGRHCFSNLSVEENLLTGAFVRKTASRSEIRAEIDRVYEYFPRLKVKRKTKGGLLSGGEQQMTAIGRALMANPQLILLDEPSMGLAPQFVEEVFEIVKNLNEKENVSFLIAEQNVMIALEYSKHGYVVENGRVVIRGSSEELMQNDMQNLYMGEAGADSISYKDVKYYHRRSPTFF